MSTDIGHLTNLLDLLGIVGQDVVYDVAGSGGASVIERVIRGL